MMTEYLIVAVFKLLEFDF